MLLDPDSPQLQPGTLYVVATPIGNLEDMTFRGLRVLQQADLIAAEDTRHTGKLLHHFQVTTPQISYHHHNRQQRQGELIERLHQGKTIALVSDAGLPSIADPGTDLVIACIEAGIAVVPIPGATAALTALCASGQATDRFVFEGFLPLKGKDRRDRISALRQELRTVILYEAPHRLLKTLEDLAESLGCDRNLTTSRELTKRYEEFWRGSIGDAISHYQTHAPKGEFTLVLAGATPESTARSEAELLSALQDLMAEGHSPSQASRQLAQVSQRPRRELYQLALQLKQPGEP